MGAMKSLKLSIHSTQYVWLRQLFLQRRLELGLSQRALAARLGVIHSLVGKVETGDRRLDVFEFVMYCSALELNPVDILVKIDSLFENHQEINEIK